MCCGAGDLTLCCGAYVLLRLNDVDGALGVSYRAAAGSALLEPCWLQSGNSKGINVFWVGLDGWGRCCCVYLVRGAEWLCNRMPIVQLPSLDSRLLPWIRSWCIPGLYKPEL